MKTNIVVLKKGISLCCLLILAAFNPPSYAQIIYTDIPDATPNASYALDLNNDDTLDFFIGAARIDQVICAPQNSNAYSGNFANGLHLAWALSDTNPICSTLSTWYGADHPGTLAWGTGTGHWAGQPDKYLALRIVVGSNTHYGWVRLGLYPSSTSFTVKDYAYESTPNTCIQAGQTILSTHKTDPSPIALFPNPLTSSSTLHTTETLYNASLTLYNAYGQTLQQLHHISGQTIPLSRDQLPSGLYFIQLTQADTIIAAQKLILTD